MMCGLAGCGKDTYIANNFDCEIISLDEIRRSNKLESHTQQNLSKVIYIAKERCKTLLRTKTPFVFNATSLRCDIRSKWISLFADYSALVEIVYIEVPYKQLLLQNKSRIYSVRTEIITKMINKLNIPTNLECHYITIK
jgi:predicted kinase